MKIAQDLEIKTLVLQGVLVIEMIGRMDSVTSPYIQRKLHELIQTTKMNMVLDMHYISYISSIGLRLLGEIANLLEKNSRHIVICSPSESVENVLRMTNFDLLFKIAPDVKQAIALLK